MQLLLLAVNVKHKRNKKGYIITDMWCTCLSDHTSKAVKLIGDVEMKFIDHSNKKNCF